MSNNENKNKYGRALPRFGVLDAVIILLVVAAICGIYFRYNIMDAISQKKNIKDYTVEFAIENINSTTTRYIQENDEVRFASNGEVLGSFIKNANSMSDSILSITPASKMFTEQGKVIKVYYPEDTRVDVKGWLRCKGTYSENGIFLVNGSVAVSSGELITVNTDEVTVTLRIVSIAAFE